MARRSHFERAEKLLANVDLFDFYSFPVKIKILPRGRFSMKALPIAMISALVTIGCAGSGSPVDPASDDGTMTLTKVTDSAVAANRVVWGFWQVSISADRNTVETFP